MAKTINKKATAKTTKKTVSVKVKAPVKKQTAVKPVKTTKPVQQKKVVKTVNKKIETKSVIKTTKKINIANVVKKVILLSLVIGVIGVAVCKIMKMKKTTSSMKENFFSFVSKDGKEKVDLKLKIADKDPLRLKGLQGVKKLEEKTGMLFDFEEPGYYSMWMKGMEIPLDMIFLNNYGQVLVVAENRPAMNEDLITPCSVAYDKLSPKAKKNINEDKFFENCENKYLKYQNLTRYVVELPVGTIKKHNIIAGDVLLKK